ncbi:hypothetical protein VTN31DRAFT_6513 [Thermomyces dupontii]|uniref:uncharacterized protein n=1 Tax=Talaromyces thermophilus TaxID=28565 RepID=UPI0037422A9E
MAAPTSTISDATAASPSWYSRSSRVSRRPVMYPSSPVRNPFYPFRANCFFFYHCRANADSVINAAVSSAVVSLCSSAGVPITVPPVTVTSSATTTPTGGASTVPGASPSGSESTGSGGWTSPTASVSDRSPPADSISTITSAPGASTTPAASSSAPVSGSSSPVSDPSPALLASLGAAVDLKFDLGLVAAMVGVAAFAL